MSKRSTFLRFAEDWLRRVLNRGERRDGFVLRDASFDGDGTHNGVRLEDWEAIRNRTMRTRIPLVEE